MSEVLLNDEAALMLSAPTRPDHYLAWAAVRAADLLRESKRLREFSTQGNDEYRRATLSVSKRCETVARRDLANPPTDACADAAVALALAYGLTRGLQDSEVYQG